MNWLAHLYLSEDDVEHRIGNVIADWVKGEARLAFSPGVQRGFACHRAIDLYTDAHPIVAQSKARIEAPFKRFAAVLVDVFYDHFLAANWDRYCDVSLSIWTAGVYAQFATYWDTMPAQVRTGLQRMAEDDWLGSYASVDGIEAILRRMSHRLSRPNLLGEATPQLIAHDDNLRSDFHLFFPQLQAHIDSTQRMTNE